jgi:hypothetical protein
VPPQDEKAMLCGYTGPVSALLEGEALLVESLRLTQLDAQIAAYRLMRDFDPQLLVSTSGGGGGCGVGGGSP